MIKSIYEKTEKRIEIDLTGPDGNVFVLMGIAIGLAKSLNKRRENEYFDIKALTADMMSGNYEHTLEVIEENFGDYIIMYK